MGTVTLDHLMRIAMQPHLAKAMDEFRQFVSAEQIALTMDDVVSTAGSYPDNSYQSWLRLSPSERRTCLSNAIARDRGWQLILFSLACIDKDDFDNVFEGYLTANGSLVVLPEQRDDMARVLFDNDQNDLANKLRLLPADTGFVYPSGVAFSVIDDSALPDIGELIDALRDAEKALAEACSNDDRYAEPLKRVRDVLARV